jgi:hypothetical protein
MKARSNGSIDTDPQQHEAVRRACCGPLIFNDLSNAHN